MCLTAAVLLPSIARSFGGLLVRGFPVCLLVAGYGAVLYLECRLLDMHTGATDSAAGEYPTAENDYRYRGPRG